MDAIHVEDLLEHSGWLRSLAAELVADPATADDLVQDTWVAALRRPPVAGRSARAWLARVLRNVDRNRRRGSARREDRELFAHAERTGPAPDDLAQEAEAQRLVAEAVAALDEPYRSVVVLRYFRGFDSRAIGARLGVPDGTVRWQLAEALKRLRARLDREHGRASWSVLLLPLTTRQAATKSAAGVPMLIQIPLALSVGVLATWGGIRLVTAADPEPVASAPTAVTALASAAPTRATLAVTTSAPSRDPQPSALVQGAAPAEVSGRFVLPSGEPVVGMTVRVHGWAGNHERKMRYGVPEDWTDPEGVTDPEGRFSVSFDAHPAFCFALKAKLPGFAEDTWWWFELRPGSHTDIGTVTLRPGGAIEGTLARADGSPVTGEAWMVVGDEASHAGSYGREATRVAVDLDVANGVFRLEDLPAGPVELTAQSPIANWIDGPTVDVVAGETVTATITYSGPDNSRRITVLPRNRLMYPLSEPAEGTIKLLGLSTGPIAANYIERSADLYSFDDLEPGVYTVEIDDPRFLPWRRDDAHTGTRVVAYLVGSSSLVLDVEDATGAPVDIYSVRVECLDVNFSPREFELHDGSAPLDDGRLAGLVPGSYRVQVDAGTAGSATLESRDLAPGEERCVSLTLASAGASGVSGIVLEQDGQPAADVDVFLLATALEDDSDQSPILYPWTMSSDETRFRKPVATVVTDSTGGFAFDHPGAGSFLVHALRGRLVGTITDVFQLVDGESHTGVELTLPGTCVLAGRIVGPPGSSAEGLEVVVVPGVSPFDSEAWSRASTAGTSTVSADGSFRSRELPAGMATAVLQLSDRITFTPEGPTGTLSLGVVQLVPGTNEHDFVPDEFPGKVDVTVLSDGAPLTGARVALVDGPSWFRAWVSADSGGLARIHHLPGSHALEVSDAEGEWVLRHPGLVTITAAETTTLEVDVELATATLTVTDANGAPLAGAALQLAFPEGGSSARVGGARTTGADGTLSLTLPPGAYVCYLLTLDGSDEDAVREGQRRLHANDPPLPEAQLTWSSAGAQITY